MNYTWPSDNYCIKHIFRADLSFVFRKLVSFIKRKRKNGFGPFQHHFVVGFWAQIPNWSPFKKCPHPPTQKQPKIPSAQHVSCQPKGSSFPSLLSSFHRFLSVLCVSASSNRISHPVFPKVRTCFWPYKLFFATVGSNSSTRGMKLVFLNLFAKHSRIWRSTIKKIYDFLIYLFFYQNGDWNVITVVASCVSICFKFLDLGFQMGN